MHTDLNLLHASAYCGLTESLSEANFFMPIVHKYGLAGMGVAKQEELAALERVKLDENGSRACSMYEVCRPAMCVPNHAHMHSPTTALVGLLSPTALTTALDCLLLWKVWAFEVIKGEAIRTRQGSGDLTPPIHARLQDEVNHVGICIKRLCALRPTRTTLLGLSASCTSRVLSSSSLPFCYAALTLRNSRAVRAT